MVLPKNNLRKCLLRKFDFKPVPGSRHGAVALFIQGKKIATTRFSRSHRDIDDTILYLIAKEIWVSLSYLKQMYDCTKNQKDYLEYLQDNGYF